MVPQPPAVHHRRLPPRLPRQESKVASVIAVLAVAANLRVALTSLSPLLGAISHDLKLSGALASGLVSLPVLCFGFAAPLALPLARRVSVGRALVVSMVALAAGLYLRVVGGTALLFAGTLIACAGIALANILGPAYVKQVAKHHPGVLMGAYSATMSAVAAAAAIGAPFAARSLGGWRVGVGIWSIPAFLAAAALAVSLPWRDARSPASRSGTDSTLPPHHSRSVTGTRVRKVRWDKAWMAVVVFTACQSLVYYTMLAWQPSIFEDHGFSLGASGTLLSVFAIVGMPLSFAIPPLFTRTARRGFYIVGVSAFTAGGLLGLAAAPIAAPLLWVVLIGMGQAGAFGIVLSLFLLHSQTPEETVKISLVAQMVGFLVASLGPLFFGEAHAAMGGWRLPTYVLAFILVPQVWAGVKASNVSTKRLEGSTTWIATTE